MALNHIFGLGQTCTEVLVFCSTYVTWSKACMPIQVMASDTLKSLEIKYN